VKLSRESEYGLAALIYMAGQSPGAIVQVKQVAEAQDLPEMFLAKIFLKLARHGVLRSYRGRERGYALARPAGQISAKEIVEGLEGATVFQRCVFWRNQCSEDRPCPLHDVWKDVRPHMVERMARITLGDIAQGQVRGLPMLGARRARKKRGDRTG
jgi:Rrf2 family protein